MIVGSSMYSQTQIIGIQVRRLFQFPVRVKVFSLPISALPFLNAVSSLMTRSALFRAMKNHSEVLLRYLYSTARSLARKGPSGSGSR